MQRVLTKITMILVLLFCIPAYTVVGGEPHPTSFAQPPVAEIKVDISQELRAGQSDVKMEMALTNTSQCLVRALSISEGAKSSASWAMLIMARDGKILRRRLMAMTCQAKITEINPGEAIRETLSLKQRFGASTMDAPGRYSILGFAILLSECSLADSAQRSIVPISPVSFEVLNKEAEPIIRLLREEPPLRIEPVILFEDSEPDLHFEITNTSADTVHLQSNDLPWISTDSVHLLTSRGIQVVKRFLGRVNGENGRLLRITSGDSISGRVPLAEAIKTLKKSSQFREAFAGWYLPHLYDANQQPLARLHIPIPLVEIQYPMKRAPSK